MKVFTISFILLYTLFLSATIYSQSNDHIYATITDIPHEITAGQSAVFSITVTNKSRSQQWSLADLKYDISFPFTITGVDQKLTILEPGQTQTLNFAILAPAEIGKVKLTVIFYNKNILLAKKTKNVKIIAGNSGITDPDEGKTNGKDKIKDKSSDKEKSKDKDKITPKSKETPEDQESLQDTKEKKNK
jgi:hypothetical protein